jgi:hypothetical protein
MRWHPASEPPVIPEGKRFVSVITCLKVGPRRIIGESIYDASKGWGDDEFPSSITHWQPMPPPPGEPDPVEELIAAAEDEIAPTSPQDIDRLTRERVTERHARLRAAIDKVKEMTR